MKKKLVSLLLIAAMGATMLAGCGGSGDDTNAGGNAGGDSQASGPKDVTLKVWVAQNQKETGIIDEQTAAFAEANKDKWNITWDIKIVGEDVAKDTVLNDVEAAADVFCFASDQTPAFVEAGAIARLGGAAEELVKSTMSESEAATVSIDGALYGVPYQHNTFVMFYDKQVMTEEDVKTMEGILSKETADGVYNYYFESAGGWKLGAWYYGAGLSVFGENGTNFDAGCDWNSETGVAVTKYLMDVIKNPKVGYDGEISVSELIAEHRLGVWFDGDWNYKLYKDALGDDLGIAILPTFNINGTDYQLKSFYSTKAAGVNPKCKNMDAAVAFAAYLGNEESQQKRFEKNAQAPVNNTLEESQAVKENEMVSAVIEEVLKASVVQPLSADFSNKYWANAGKISTEIKNGNITADNVQEQMDKIVKDMTTK
ncbi:MAG: extracellular solute-binding protein [Lachnospiraceae bacterium]|nr:extracellular solute-binding protein [Lachnospiraceae bacterium]